MTSALVSTRQPEAYKMGQNVRAWIQRLDEHFIAVNMADTIQQGSAIANVLNNEVHAAIFKLNMPLETWSDPNRLRPY